jgi:hypothetical protein
MNKVYISGPMTGIPEFNFPAFNAKAAELRAGGCEPVSPVENGVPAGAPWVEHMRADIRMLLDCDGIHMLPGWSKSRGATLEHSIAVQLGLRVTGVVA